MIYHTLEEVIYRNSRYELIQLLEDIYPTRQCKFKNINAFNEMANVHELLIDKYFPALPLSEERLAIFSRIFSDHGVISQALIEAVESGMRAVIFSILHQVDISDNQNYIALKRRRFYEATMLGNE